MAEEGAQVELQEISKKPENTETEDAEPAKTDDNDVEPSGPSVVEGTDNPAYNPEQESSLQDDLPPPMTFVDFMPMLIEPGATNADAPVYAEFRYISQ